MNVTAIIPHYWDSRAADLVRVVRALHDASVQKAIVWNNSRQAVDVPAAEVIQSGKNWGIAARFAAAYLARTEYVLFQDNDLLVQPETVSNLLEHGPQDGESVELQGRVFGPWEAPYSQSSYVSGLTPGFAGQVVDVGLSRLSLMRRSTAMRLTALIPPDVTDDDIWTSRHCRIRIVPAAGAACGYVNLPEVEGLCSDAVAHVMRRDELVRQLWPERA